MSADAAAVLPHRLSSIHAHHIGLRLLRRYSAGVVLCALLAAIVLAVQANSTPYPLPVALELLVAMFLLVAVCIRLGLTRQRWYEVCPDGLRFQGAFNRTHFVHWTAMRDLRYFAGVALPFSVQVRGRSAPIRLGLAHSDLSSWTTACVERMPLDLRRGGPLHAFRWPPVLVASAVTLGLAIAATPVSILRALNGRSDYAWILLMLISVSGLLVVLLHQPLWWDTQGILLGRGGRARHTPWAAVQATWQPTVTGSAGLYVQLGTHGPMRVWLGGWGAPRFVARLAEGPLRPAQAERRGAASTGLFFALMLGVVTLLAGSQFRESARLFASYGPGRAAATFGTPTAARILHATRNGTGFDVRYSYVSNGTRYRGRGWLPAAAEPFVRANVHLPIRYATSAPAASLLQGDPTLFHAAYFALFGLFYGLLVLPLLALLDVPAAPAPYTVPNVAT